MSALLSTFKYRYLETVNPFRNRVIPALIFISFSLLICAQQLQVNPSPLALTNELKTRIDAAAYTQKTGSPADVANASKRVISLALAEMAETRSIQGALPASVALYRESLAYEDTPRGHYWLALTYNVAGHTDDALRETAAVLAADPKDASAWNLQGKLQLQKQQYREAADSLGKSLALRTDMEAAYTMASALLQAKEFDKAAAVFRQMEEISGRTAGMHIMVARAYEGAGMFEQAEKEYRVALSSDAKGSHAHYFLGLFLLERNQWESTPQIVEEFHQEVALNPTDFFGNYFLGYLSSVAKNYDESDKFLKVAAAAKPDWPEPYLYMGLNAAGRGNDKEAEELLRQAIKLTGTDEERNDYQIRRAYFTLGRILSRKGLKVEGARYSEKSKEMETHLVVKARQSQALDSRQTGGVVVISKDSPATAKKEVSLDLKGDPSAPLDPGTLSGAQLTPEAQSQLAATEKQLRIVLGNAFNDLGTSFARQRDFAPALKEFQNGERWNPATDNLMRNLGMAAYRSGDFKESARALKVAVDLQPQDERARGLLGMSLSSTGDYAAAASTFDRLGDVTLADPEMAYRWALSLVKTSQNAQAKGVLAKMSRSSVPYDVLVKACKLYADMGDSFDAQACSNKAKALASSESSPR